VRRLPAGQVDLVRVAEVNRRFLDVFGHVHEDRSAAARASDVEGRLHDVRELLDVLDEPRVLDDRERDPGGVDLLEGVGPDQVGPNLARDADEGRRVHPGIRDRGHEIRRARAGSRHGDPDAARSPCVSLGHVTCALLVTGEDVPYARPAGDRVVRGQDRPAGDPEHHVHALRLERAEDGVGTEHLGHQAYARR
jgi:hypothetical protein